MAPDIGVWPGLEPARSVDALLGDLVAHAAQAGAAVQGSVWARRRGTDWRLASTGDRVDRCEAAAVRADGPRAPGRGPEQQILVPDVQVEQRWQHWCEVVLGQRFRSATVLSASLARGDQVSLSLYADQPDVWADALLRRATGFAVQMASLVDLHATIPERRAARPSGGASQRRRHATVEQAVGVLMERRGCDAAAALRVLTVMATARSTTVEQVAGAVVEGAAVPDDAHRHG
ncbi:MAG TPA: ANTAR domain-containing protein [Cellulomonas sp.]